jgi:hypothetical protein
MAKKQLREHKRAHQEWANQRRKKATAEAKRLRMLGRKLVEIQQLIRSFD